MPRFTGVNMKKKSLIVLSIFILLLFPTNLLSQEEEQQEQEQGHFFISIEDWYASISNIDYELSTRYSLTGANSTNIYMPSSNGDSARYRLAWMFSDDMGTIEISFWGFSNKEKIVKTDVGNFVFAQNLSFPLYAGIFDDGMADGVASDSYFAVRSVSLLYGRALSKSERMYLHWKIGARKISYKHRFNTEYLSLAPVLLNPFPPEELMPISDKVWERSSLEARGIETGASIVFPIAQRFSFGGDLGFSFLAGRSDTEFTSKNYYYTSGGGYFNPRDQAITENDIQESSMISSNAKDVDSHIQILEANLKFTWNIWRTLDLTVGYALSLWNGALTREQILLSQSSESNFFQRSRSERTDISFEGFFAALSYRY